MKRIILPGKAPIKDIMEDDEAAAWLAKNPGGQIEDVSWDIARPIEYKRQIDPFFQEAILDHHLGDSTKLNALIVRYSDIKRRHPKP